MFAYVCFWIVGLSIIQHFLLQRASLVANRHCFGRGKIIYLKIKIILSERNGDRAEPKFYDLIKHLDKENSPAAGHGDWQWALENDFER